MWGDTFFWDLGERDMNGRMLVTIKDSNAGRLKGEYVPYTLLPRYPTLPPAAPGSTSASFRAVLLCALVQQDDWHREHSPLCLYSDTKQGCDALP